MHRLRTLVAVVAAALVTSAVTAAPAPAATPTGTLHVTVVDANGVPQAGRITAVLAQDGVGSSQYAEENTSSYDFTVPVGRYGVGAVTYWGGMVCEGFSPCTVYGGAASVPGVVDVVAGQTSSYTVVMPGPPVTVAGTPAVGNVLSADLSPAMTAWTTSPYALYGSIQYQWLRDGVDIPQATSRTYALTVADAGHQVSVRVGYLTSVYTTSYVGGDSTARVFGPVSVPVQGTETFASLARGTVSGKQRGRVRVDVTSGAALVPGRVTVTVGKRRWTVPLRNGSARLELPKLKPGTYTVGATYLPEAGYGASTSPAAKLVVKKAKKPKKHRT